MPWGTGEDGKVTSADYNNQHAGDPYPGTSKRTSLTREDDTVNYPVYTSNKQDWALIDIKEENQAITFTFLRDKTTSGIGNIRDERGDKSQTASWHTLDGRRLTTAPVQKGIYLKDGRKVVVK